MKRLLLAGAVMASACASEPSAVVVRQHKVETEGDTARPAPLHPLTITDEAAATTTLAPVTTTTTEAPTTTAAPRRAAPATTVYEPPSPQSRTTGRGSEPAGGDYGEWSIPAYIVMCESGGHWDAYNASGASGPYQIMPMHFGGELAMNQSRAAQHAKAAELWAGGAGARNWAACL